MGFPPLSGTYYTMNGLRWIQSLLDANIQWNHSVRTGQKRRSRGKGGLSTSDQQPWYYHKKGQGRSTLVLFLIHYACFSSIFCTHTGDPTVPGKRLILISPFHMERHVLCNLKDLQYVLVIISYSRLRGGIDWSWELAILFHVVGPPPLIFWRQLRWTQLG